MKVGEYEYQISATGFSDFKQSGILLSVGTTDSVTVSADAAIVDQGKIAQQEVLGETEIRSLPITSRNVYNLRRLRHNAVYLRWQQPLCLDCRRSR